MLNQTSYKIGGNSTTVTFNQPSAGIIQKSHPKSRFVRFHKKSDMADWVFAEQPVLGRKNNYGNTQKYPITVLQIMVFGSDELLVEIVHDEYLTEEKEI